MNYQVRSLFAVPLYQANLGPVDPIARAWILNLDYPYQSVGVDATEEQTADHNKGMRILNRAPLKQLKSLIMQHVDNYVYNVLGISDQAKFTLTTSWVNRYCQGDSVDSHNHQNSLVSGVYYIEVDQHASPIIFEQGRNQYSLFQSAVKPPIAQPNEYNIESYGLQPVTGDLLLFPSHLEHQVPRQESTSPRYSLAFNLFAQGTWGEGSNQITL